MPIERSGSTPQQTDQLQTRDFIGLLDRRGAAHQAGGPEYPAAQGQALNLELTLAQRGAAALAPLGHGVPELNLTLRLAPPSPVAIAPAYEPAPAQGPALAHGPAQRPAGWTLEQRALVWAVREALRAQAQQAHVPQAHPIQAQAIQALAPQAQALHAQVPHALALQAQVPPASVGASIHNLSRNQPEQPEHSDESVHTVRPLNSEKIRETASGLWSADRRRAESAKDPLISERITNFFGRFANLPENVILDIARVYREVDAAHPQLPKKEVLRQAVALVHTQNKISDQSREIEHNYLLFRVCFSSMNEAHVAEAMAHLI